MADEAWRDDGRAPLGASEVPERTRPTWVDELLAALHGAGGAERPAWADELLTELRGAVEAEHARPEWVDELLTELRRAGRAAVAARAAAEACEQRLEARDAATSGGSTAGAGNEEPALRLLEALLPTFDAVARMAAAAAEPREAPSLLQRLRRGREVAEQRALRDAIAVLGAQMTGALEACGVELDREVGGAVDAERHRVVEATPGAVGEAAGTVRHVVRAGVRFGGRRVREADVVVTR